MRRNKCRWLSFAMGMILAMSLGACGDAGNPQSVIDNGAEEFADGKKEEDYELLSNDDVMNALMDDFSGSFDTPEGTEISEDEADEIVDDADDDQVIQKDPQNTEDVIASDDDLKELMAEMLDDTKEVATFACDPSYTFDADTINYLWEMLVYEDAYDAICLDTFSWGGTSDKMTLSFGYSIDAATLKEMKSQERSQVSKAIKELENTIDAQNSSDYEIICAVNDYLCDLITYPDEDLTKYPGDGYAPETHTAYNAFANGSAVCDGYSKAAKLMLNELGIEAGIEVGTCTNGGGHAWNIVKCDGSWYQLDVTWNDGSGDSDPDGRTWYLLVTDDYMKQSRTWDATRYPATPSQAYQG